MLVFVQISDADELMNVKVGRRRFFASDRAECSQHLKFFNQSVFG